MSRSWRFLLAVLIIAWLTADGTQAQPLQPPRASGAPAGAYGSSDSSVLFGAKGLRPLVKRRSQNSETDGEVNYAVPSGAVTSAVTPATARLNTGQPITVTINIDMSGVSAPDDKLGSFTGSLEWDPALLAYHSNSGLLAGFIGLVNTTNVATGRILFNGANPMGATGNVIVLTITLDAVGAGTSVLNLQYTAMAAAGTFTVLLPILTVTDGQVVVGTGLAGDMDGDCDVDVVDIMLVASLWGSSQGGANYDWRYDLDSDGDIDVVDIMSVAAHWGGVCNPARQGSTRSPEHQWASWASMGRPVIGWGL